MRHHKVVREAAADPCPTSERNHLTNQDSHYVEYATAVAEYWSQGLYCCLLDQEVRSLCYASP